MATNPNTLPSTTTTFTTDPPPPNPEEKGGGGGSIVDSFPTLFPLVIAAACVLGLVLAFLVIWFTRRRRRRGRRGAFVAGKGGKGGDGGDGGLEGSNGTGSARPSAEGEGEGEGEGKGGVGGEGFGGSARRKLQKACSVGAGPGWWAREGGSGLLSDDEDGEGRGWPRRHVSMPLIPRACSRGHFHFGVGGGGGGGGGGGSSCRWPGPQPGAVEMGEVRIGKRKPSWIDADALHGPKVAVKGESGAGKKKSKGRGSWPLRNRTPTLPRVHHTVHGYPYMMSGARGESSEALLGENNRPKTSTRLEYAQLRASSRDLPQPPKPALVLNRERRVIRPSVTMGYVYGASNIPTPIISPPPSPVRSAPTTPQRHRGRQRSTDSTLTDILRSTEERLREGSVSGTIRSRRATSSPTRASPGKVFGPREYGVPASRARTPSPTKMAAGEPFTPGHKRQASQKSVSSESDSLVGNERPVSDVPSGLTSPSRAQKKQEPEKLLAQASTRTSLSSELSTLYSEDEMPDEVKRAIMPLEGLMVQPQQAAKVRPPSMNDPFVSAPFPLSVSRAASVGGWPTKHSKSQDLLRQSVQRSQRLRSMTVGHPRAQSQGLILAPGPVIQGPKTGVPPGIPPSRKTSVTIPRSMQPYIVSRASEPPPSPTRQSLTGNSPNGPLFLRVTKTSTLSTIPLLPPPSAPSIDIFRKADSKQHSPSKPTPTTEQQQQQQQPARRSTVLLLPSTERSSAPASPTRRVGGELRLSLILPPKPLQGGLQPKRASASSSVYSQEAAASPTTTAVTAQTAAIELNRANFRANASLYPAPLSPHYPNHNRNTNRSRGGPSPSNLSSELPLDGAAENEGEDEKDDDEDDDEDTPLALTATIASLRRMNSGLSIASSLMSIADRDRDGDGDMSASPSLSVNLNPSGSPGWGGSTSLGGGGSLAGSPERVGGFGNGESPRSHRKSIGARNYYILGGGGGNGVSSRRGSRVVSCSGGGVGGGIVKSPSGGGGGGVGVGGSGVNGPPSKRRRPGSMHHHHQRRSSAALRLSRSEFATAGAGAGEEGKENSAGIGGFKVAAGEFTFEVSNPNNGSGKGGLGLRESSSGSVNAVVLAQHKDAQRLSLAWRPAEGGASRNGSPVRFNGSPSRQSMRSVESLGLYDRQGFLIPASPVRGVSPSGLRV